MEIFSFTTKDHSFTQNNELRVFMQNSLMKFTYTKMIVNWHKCLHTTVIEVDYCANKVHFELINVKRGKCLSVNIIESDY